MKKVLFSLIAVLLFSTVLLSAKGPYTRDHSDLNIGVGFGSTLYGDAAIPPITASYEIPLPVDSPSDITKKISVGGVAGISMTESDYYFGTYSYTHIIIGARGSYHFYNEGNIDAYGGLMIGYNIVSSSYESKSGHSDYGHSTSAGSGITYSAYVGGRYYFSDSFGAFLELGYGLAYLNLGVTLKL